VAILFNSEEFAKVKNLLNIYRWGLRTLRTKLDIIHEDLKHVQDNSAIDYMMERIKTPESIAQKLHNLGVDITAENARKYLKDIAGIRIITSFADEIYFLADIIRSIPDVTILVEKDFVSNPKPSGYRSYHLIAEVPIFFSGKVECITAEIQIRTSAMNFWATLEHKARYKFKGEIPAHLSSELSAIADKTAELDKRMFTIHDIINLINEKKE